MTNDKHIINIVGLGNPLLDISSHVSQSLLDKYGLKTDNAILAEPTHLPLYDELAHSGQYNVDYIAGGATQNSIRIAQWLLQIIDDNNYTTFFGCIGKDEFGNTLTKCAKNDNVNVQYMIHDQIKTGTCAVLIKDKERSLVANLSAANEFKIDHLLLKQNQDIINKSEIFYSAGFHLTVSPDSMLHLAKNVHNNNKNKIFAINLSAPFIITFFKDKLDLLLPYCDYVFGNENEALELGKSNNWGNDLAEIAKQTANIKYLNNDNNNKSRTVVFTQGSKSTIVYSKNKLIQFDVPKMNKDDIVDTNGAGDAFVGGFLAMLAIHKDLEQCVDAGHWAAQFILKQSGCAFPKKCDFQLTAN